MARGSRGRGWLTADRAIQIGAVGSVVLVGAFAAVQSYTHISELARAHGESVMDSRLLPLSVDGLILESSLVMLYRRRRGEPPVLSRVLLWFGIAGTVGANVIFGLPFGPLGAAVAGVPAAVFVGSVEVLMSLVGGVRRVRWPWRRPGGALALWRPPEAEPDAAALARQAYDRTAAAGNPLSARQLRLQHGVSKAEAGRIVRAASNGH